MNPSAKRGTRRVSRRNRSGKDQPRLTFESLEPRCLLANQSPFLTNGTVGDLTLEEDSGIHSLNLDTINYSAGEANQTLTYTVAVVPNPSLGNILLEDNQTIVKANTNYTLNQIRRMRFQPVPNIAGGPTTFRFAVKDNGGTADGGVDTLQQSIAITITGINDEPTFLIGADQAVTATPGARTIANWATRITAGVGESSQSLTFDLTEIGDSKIFTVKPAISTTGTLTYTLNGTPGVAFFNVLLKDNGGTDGSGHDTSEIQRFRIHALPSIPRQPRSYAVVDLLPNVAASATVNAIANNKFYGSVDYDLYQDRDDHAAVWSSVTGTPVDLYPVSAHTNRDLSSTVTAAEGTKQGGWRLTDDAIQRYRAMLWSGTAASAVDLHPATFFHSAVLDISAQKQVGWATKSIDSSISQEHAMLWSGTAASVVDLHPATGYTETRANGVDGNVQVGQGLSTANGLDTVALMWTGTAASVKVLAIPSFSETQRVGTQTWANDVSGDFAVGGAIGELTVGNRAIIWDLDNNTFTDVTPLGLGYDSAELKAINGLHQVGTARGPNTLNLNHAMAWRSTAATAIDLHYYLPAGFISSEATDVDSAGNVVGFAVDAEGTRHPVMWKLNGNASNQPPVQVVGRDIQGSRVSSDDAWVLDIDEDSAPQYIFQNPLKYIGGFQPADASQSLTYYVTELPSASLGKVVLENTNTAVIVGGNYSLTQLQNMQFKPAANQNGVGEYFRFEVRDNSGTSTNKRKQWVTINLNSVNDAPSFTAGPNLTLDPGVGAQSLANWAKNISVGPANESSQTAVFRVFSNSNPGLFDVAPSISSTGTLSFTPSGGTGTASIRIYLQDSGPFSGDSQNSSGMQDFTITFSRVDTPANDPPIRTAGIVNNLTIAEDSGLTSLGLENVAYGPGGGPDEQNQTLTYTVTGVPSASLGTVVLANGTTAVTAGTAYSLTQLRGMQFKTLPNVSGGPSTFKYEVKDSGGTAGGGVNTLVQSLSITVLSANDAPSFTAGTNQTVNEDAGAQTVAAWAQSISPDPANEASQIISFEVTTNKPQLFSVQPKITANGTLSYTPAPNASGLATLTVVAKDSGGTANGGKNTSAEKTFTIMINPINDAPTFTKGPNQTSFTVNGPISVTGWATNISPGAPLEEGQSLAFQITGNTNAALFTSAPTVSADGTLAYTPAGIAGTATITLLLKDGSGTANGGSDTSAPQSFTITVIEPPPGVNTAPSFTKGANQVVTRNSGAQSIANWATGISAGLPAESNQGLTFQVTGNTNPNLFSFGPVVNASNGLLAFTPAANATGTATITLVLKDNGGTANGGQDTSAPQTFTITVNPSNAAPSFKKGVNQLVNEDSGAKAIAGWATNISPGPAAEAGQALSFQVTGNTAPTLFSAAPTVSPDGTLSYTPAPNAYGTATISLMLKDDGGTAGDGQDTSVVQTFTITIRARNDIPTFVKGPDQTVSANSGTQSVDGWATDISAGPNEADQGLTFQVIDNTNPSLFSFGPALNAANGLLAFTPAADATGTATITVVLKDNGGTDISGKDTSLPQTFTIVVEPAVQTLARSAAVESSTFALSAEPSSNRTVTADAAPAKFPPSTLAPHAAAVDALFSELDQGVDTVWRHWRSGRSEAEDTIANAIHDLSPNDWRDLIPELLRGQLEGFRQDFKV